MKPALPHSLPGALSSRFSPISLSSNLPQAPIKWIITAPKSSLRGFPLIPSRHLTPFLLSWWHNELLFRGEPLNRPLWKCGMCQGPGWSGSWWLACWGQRGHQGHRVPPGPRLKLDPWGPGQLQPARHRADTNAFLKQRKQGTHKPLAG